MTPNYDSIDQAQQQLVAHLDEVREEMKTMQELILNDYDGFLKQYVPEDILIDAQDDSVFLDQISVTLFD